MTMRRRLGLDGPVAYTFLARIVNIVGSTGTVLLIVRFLSPVEQGYYYTLLSLVSLQMVFELGFSFVIQQLATHECVHLQSACRRKRDRRPRGTSSSGIRSAAYVAVVYRCSRCNGSILVPLGTVFFAHHTAGAHPVAWQGPWLTARIWIGDGPLVRTLVFIY